MNTIDPTTLSVAQLQALGTHAVHQLSLRAAGTLVRYRLMLGRCLLALQRSHDYGQFGCSSAIHYASAILGLRPETARQLRCIALKLEGLPQLTHHAQAGTLSWAKLREVVRVASVDTEAFWIEACQNHSYREIERLVRHCRPEMSGGSHESELKIRASAEAMAILERAMQSLSQEAGRPLSPGEALEYLAAEYLARRPLDEEALQAARLRAQQDQQAARQRDQALLEQAQRSARNVAPWVAAEAEACAHNPEVAVVKRVRPHWNNPRARCLTPAQRTQVLRRDGYRCQCPGCPNRLFLHVHHIIYYCQQGATHPDNLVTLCSSCHRNVHQGHLRIEGQSPGQLTFRDAHGRSLTRQHRLEVAEWLDWFVGWSGGEQESHRALTLAAAA